MCKKEYVYGTRELHPIRHARESGQVLVLTAIALLSLLAITGLATDVGLLWTQKREMQTAADAAAIGGAWELAQPGIGQASAAARKDAERNGYKHGPAGVTVTVNTPPTSGEFMGMDDAVEVIIRQPKPTYFLRVLGISSVVVQARAVARMRGARNCLYVLHPSASGALKMAGTGTLSANCGIMVNSSSSDALKITGNACISVTAISIKGGYLNGGNSCLLVPTPVTGVPAVPDPLAGVAPPAVGACNYTNYKATGVPPVVTLNPGVYCGGINIAGGSVVFNPGTYILKGGGLIVKSGTVVSGTGVTFYNTEGGGYAYAAIDIAENVTVTLLAPTTGPLAGILFFQDRSISSNKVNTISNNVLSTIQGVFYFPTTTLKYTGSETVGVTKTLIVVYELDMLGNAKVDINFPLPPILGASVTGAALAE